MDKIILLLILSFTFCISTHAQNCGFSFTGSNFVASVNTSLQSISQQLNIRKTNPNANCRSVRVYFTRGQANNYDRHAKNGQKTVPYNIYKESALNNVLKDFGDASSNEYISLNLPDVNTNYTLDYFVKVIDLDSVFTNGPGTYNDLIEAKLYSVKNNGDLIYHTSKYINMQFIIPRYAELSLGGIGSGHDPSSTQHIMSFGTLATGKTAAAELHIKSTVSFGVYMSSLNGSFLKNGAAQIPYQININGSGFRSLSNPGQSYYITQRNLSSPVNYETIPILAQVGPMPVNPDTGEYTDVITITITPW